MKRILMTIAVAMMMFSSACAQRLTDVVAEARFITDKMVVELGLTSVQRNNILQLNLTYLDGITSYRDINSKGWKYRNRQMKAMLSDRQWKKYKDSYYFYRPIEWRNNAYVHNIYAKYPKKRGFGTSLGSRRYGPPSYGRPERKFGNNSKEAIKMRKEMRKGMKKGAR